MPVNELSQAQENTQQLLVTLHLSCAVVIEITGKFRFDKGQENYYDYEVFLL